MRDPRFLTCPLQRICTPGVLANGPVLGLLSAVFFRDAGLRGGGRAPCRATVQGGETSDMCDRPQLCTSGSFPPRTSEKSSAIKPSVETSLAQLPALSNAPSQHQFALEVPTEKFITLVPPTVGTRLTASGHYPRQPSPSPLHLPPHSSPP